mmetsp:Transcript_99861/g.298270  ORF Transcript_99861/g.298270 Transcript_99861/m.298270 type:complete len:332 (+) Transcript_99861:369-1364(+)
MRRLHAQQDPLAALELDLQAHHGRRGFPPGVQHRHLALNAPLPDRCRVPALARIAGPGALARRSSRALTDLAPPHDLLRRPAHRLRALTAQPHARATAGRPYGAAQGGEDAVPAVGELRVAGRALPEPVLEGVRRPVDHAQEHAVGVPVFQDVREVAIQNVTQQLLRCGLTEVLEGSLAQLHPIPEEGQWQRQRVVSDEPGMHGTPNTVAHDPRPGFLHRGVEPLDARLHRCDVNVQGQGRLLSAGFRHWRTTRGPALASGASCAAARAGTCPVRRADCRTILGTLLTMATVLGAVVPHPREAVVLQELAHLLNLSLEVVALGTQPTHLRR